ncbi:envelope stress response membrane protein PspB [Hirschia maritima]|uniref:envelope stress response membrane protein PspB n=1 Tax=Hirschia maritima TaxID=1121961 RepID=UPI00037AC418|nr:envelope stress response membrane protein PspB [Hirschia maritima]
MDQEFLIPIVAILSIFVIFPWMCMHYFTMWRSNKGLSADDERMLEDLWRSARKMERRIETIERLVEPEGRDTDAPPRRRRDDLRDLDG